MNRRPRTVTVDDKMQRVYRYVLVAPPGRNFDAQFHPDLTPKEMLALGVFCGKYLTDCRGEFPASWFVRAKLSRLNRDCALDYFGVDEGQMSLRRREFIALGGGAAWPLMVHARTNWRDNQLDLLPKLAADLVQRQVSVIVAPDGNSSERRAVRLLRQRLALQLAKSSNS